MSAYQILFYVPYLAYNLRPSIAILVNNAFKTVQQSAKDKEDICRRADARQKYLTQISHSDGLD